MSAIASSEGRYRRNGTYPKHDIHIGDDSFGRTLGDLRYDRGRLPRRTKGHLVAIRALIGENVVQLYRRSTDDDVAEQ